MYIGYARVSTHDQHLDLQQDALKQVGCKRIIVDRVSGTVAERPGLKQIKDIVREGDTLVVWRLDRLGRSIKDLIEWVHWLEQEGAGLKSLQEAIDTTSTGGKLTFHIFAALAEFERQLIQERTQAGLQAARARGRLGGRPKALTREQTETGGRAVPGEAVGRAGNLQDHGYFEADPLCLCPSGAIRPHSQPSYLPPRKASLMPKKSRGQKRQAKTKKRQQRQARRSSPRLCSLSGRHAVWRRT